MLNSCGLALNQGGESDFHPRCNWEATPPGYRACVRAWRRLASCHGATPAQTYYGSPVKLEEYMGMLAGVTDCRRSRKWGCRGRWALGFKPRHDSHRREDHVVLECCFLPCSLGTRRDFAGTKREAPACSFGNAAIL